MLSRHYKTSSTANTDVFCLGKQNNTTQHVLELGNSVLDCAVDITTRLYAS